MDIDASRLFEIYMTNDAQGMKDFVKEKFELAHLKYGINNWEFVGEFCEE